MLATIELDAIFRQGLHEFLTGFVADNNQLTDIVAKDYHFG